MSVELPNTLDIVKERVMIIHGASFFCFCACVFGDSQVY